jgi:tetratricopeptide (TPR) repeat protein
MTTSRCAGSSGSGSGENVSEPKKPSGSDPFEGMDWDKELDSWDKSLEKGGASVPNSFSDAPAPAGGAPKAPPRPAPPAAKPLYRPPVAPAKPSPASTAIKTPLAMPVPTPAAGRPASKTTPPPPNHSLPSLLDDDEHQMQTKGGAPVRSLHDDDDDDEHTVVAPVSQDLLDELQAAGITRRKRPEPPPRNEPKSAQKPASSAVEIDLGGLDEESAVKSDADDPDASVITSAPDVVKQLRTGSMKSIERPVMKQVDHSVAEGEMFDPFKGLSTEPAASEAVAKTPTPPPEKPGPQLLAPSARRHSESEETAILDKARIQEEMDAATAAVAATAASAGVASDPFGATDPFATPLPPDPAPEPAPESAPVPPAAPVLRSTQDFYSAPQQSAAPSGADDDEASLEAGEIEQAEISESELAGEEGGEGALIDLLRGEEQTGDGLPKAVLPPASLPPPGGEKSAVEYLGGRAAEWRARAERVANDARSHEKAQKSRGLVVASELAAIAGDRAFAIELAEEAWEAAPGEPLAIRQLRQLFAAEGRWDDVAPLLESEIKGPGSHAVKSHAALLAADAARLVRGSPDEAPKLYETAQRTSPGDVRPMLARALPAIALGKPPPLLRWPPGVGAEPLGDALARRVKSGEPAEDTQLATVLEGLATFAEGEGGAEGALGVALDELASSATVGGAARWVRLALDAARIKGRPKALASIASSDAVPAGRSALEARLAIALDSGDAAHATEAATALAKEHASAATTLARNGLEIATGTPPSTEPLAAIAAEPGVHAIGRAVALATGAEPDDAFASTDALDAATRIARRLVRGGEANEELRARASAPVLQGFRIGDALASGSVRQTLDALAPVVPWPSDAANDETLAKLFAEVAEGNLDGARDAATQASSAEPTEYPAPYALLALGGEGADATALATAEASTDDDRAAALALHVAIRALARDDRETTKRAAEIALQRAEGHPVAAFLAELRARRDGDFDGVVEALRARAQGTSDPSGRAGHLVREILLLMGTDLATCIERAQEAAQLAPDDPTVRALYERIAGEGAQGRAEWRAELASTLDGHAKADTLLDAAREGEKRGDYALAEKHALAAEQAGGGADATTLRHRAQARGDGASRLAEELLEKAKATEDTNEQREAYEALADLDLYARGDATSAILWHRAILEATPGHLPSLRRLEHMMISAGREDDYEATASELARTLPPEARDAHTEVAARLRLRRPGTPWESIADLIALATEREHPSLWATRLLDAWGRFKAEDDTTLRALDLLLARADRPNEVATLATRAAEAAFRKGDAPRARAYLERALEADPHHPTGLASMAELRRHEGDMRGAAEAIESQAQTQLVAEHRLEDWHSAAALWLDSVGDTARGRAALENAAEIDFGYADVFDRLVGIARAGKEHDVVADLYQRRLVQIDDVTQRAALQVDYARVLVELGDREGARVALASALDLVPGDLEALREGARLAEEAEDWSDLETYLTRLTESLPDADAQLDVHRRLADLYETHLPDAPKAEQTFRKILEQVPEDDDVLRRLVAVYVELGDGEQAVDVHKERVVLASDPKERRVRLIELAKLLDEQANDPERALKALEQARAGDAADLTALAALAEFHTKHGHPELVASALDGAIADLRRKIGENPADIGQIEQLVKILELRGHEDAMRAVHAVLAGYQGSQGELIGAEDGAAVAELDALLCPADLPQALRNFLARAGEAIEKSVPVDLRALKAAKLGTTNPALKAKIDAVAHGFALPDADVVISRAMALLCLPVGAKPFQIVIGEAIVATTDDVARRFALARAMKITAAHSASLIRVPPADLKIYLDALLHHLHPEYPAPVIEAERLDEITKRFQRFIPRKEEAEMKALAQAAVEAGIPSTEALAGAAATWGDRVALLAVGDVGAALRGVAWSLGQKEPPLADAEARKAWFDENSAARDLVAFAISDLYLEARKVAGVG